jgi:hypothetical protein
MVPYGMPDNNYECRRCETLFPAGKLDKSGPYWTCKDTDACIKRRVRLMNVVATEEPYNGMRDNYTRRSRRD